MSRQFNGTTQNASVALDLSASGQLSISFWLWWDAFANNDKLAFEHGGANQGNNGFNVDPNAGGAPQKFGFGFGFPSKNWFDQFTRPSAAAWHHYLFTMNRATPVNVAYVDGVLQSLTTQVHDAATYGTWSNSTLRFMSRAGTSLFGAGRLAHVAIWSGTILTARNALALSSGASPMRIGPVPTYYWPLWGDAADADYGGLRKTLTLIAAPTVAAHPPVFARAF